jgi:hypothetical protein
MRIEFVEKSYNPLQSIPFRLVIEQTDALMRKAGEAALYSVAELNILQE